jgi:hypothetical protein
MSSATHAHGRWTAVPPSGVRPKLGGHHVRLVAVAVIAGLAGIIGVIGAVVHPTPPDCGFYCGPHVEAPLAAASTYVNKAHGFSIDYPAASLSVATDQSDVVEFHSKLGPIQFKVVKASSLDAAIKDAADQLPSATFQDMEQIGPVRGAEIGYVPGKGTAWSASYAPSGGGGSSPVRIAVIAAQSHGLTLVATMFSDYDSDTAHAPYGLAGDALFDYPISNFHWPGE